MRTELPKDIMEDIKRDYEQYCQDCIRHNVHPLPFSGHWYDDHEHLKEQWGEQ